MARQTAGSSLQNEFGEAYGMQHQPAPVTPIHVPNVKDSSNRRRGRRNRRGAEETSEPVNLDRQHQGGRNEWLAAGSLFYPCASKEWCWRGQRSSMFPEAEMKAETGRQDLGHCGSSNSNSSRKE